MNATLEPPGQIALHVRLERQLNALLVISRRWRLYESDLQSAFKAITESAADALAVDRVSVWLLDDARQALVCQDLYEHGRHRHSRGFKLARRDHPEYFAALETEELVAAADAHHDARTRSFRSGYLDTHGIGAMLDAPVRVSGKLTGVLCHEHIGGPRLFMADEQTAALCLASLASLACEIQGRLASEQRAAHTLALCVAAVECAGVGVFASDTTGRVVHTNDKLREVWGFPDELMGPVTEDHARLDFTAELVCDPAGFTKRMRAMIADPAAHLDAYRFELKDGRTLETSSRPQVVDNKIVGRVWTVRDITGGN